MNAPTSIRLYRFLSAEACRKTLSSWSFRVGRIHELNDPFEWRFGLLNIRPDAEPHAQAHLTQMLHVMSKVFGIFCFSEAANEPVLWSHYADKHQGVAIEVDYLLEPRSIFKVHYTDSRPTLDANKLADPQYTDTEATKTIRKLIATKSNGWSYEREWRGYVNLSECEEREGNFYKPIPTDFVKRIILGAECALDPLEISQLISNHSIEPIEVCKARYSLHTYLEHW